MVKMLKEDEHDDVILAADIMLISASLNKLFKSGLNEKAVVALLHDDTKVPKTQIKKIMLSLTDLAKTYVSKGREPENA